MPTTSERNLNKQGGSYFMSLPKGFIDYFKLNSDSKVFVIANGKVVVYPSKEAYEKDRENVKKFLGIDSTKGGEIMPNVTVRVWEGFGPEKAEKVISGITRTFAELGISEEYVEVIIHEIPKTHWGIGGKPVSP
jgi:4-oxalocrotonate tautomerase